MLTLAVIAGLTRNLIKRKMTVRFDEKAVVFIMLLMCCATGLRPCGYGIAGQARNDDAFLTLHCCGLRPAISLSER